MIDKLKKWFWNILISIDQFANTVLWGDPDETLSSRMGKQVRKGERGVQYLICKFLSLFDKRHCVKSIEEDEGDGAV